jgi:hypothetical protein
MGIRKGPWAQQCEVSGRKRPQDGHYADVEARSLDYSGGPYKPDVQFMIVGLFHSLYFNSPHTCWWNMFLGIRPPRALPTCTFTRSWRQGSGDTTFNSRGGITYDVHGILRMKGYC